MRYASARRRGSGAHAAQECLLLTSFMTSFSDKHTSLPLPHAVLSRCLCSARAQPARVLRAARFRESPRHHASAVRPDGNRAAWRFRDGSPRACGCRCSRRRRLAVAASTCFAPRRVRAASAGPRSQRARRALCRRGCRLRLGAPRPRRASRRRVHHANDARCAPCGSPDADALSCVRCRTLSSLFSAWTTCPKARARAP